MSLSNTTASRQQPQTFTSRSSYTRTRARLLIPTVAPSCHFTRRSFAAACLTTQPPQLGHCGSRVSEPDSTPSQPQLLPTGPSGCPPQR
jgi:hypothetical protein